MLKPQDLIVAVYLTGSPATTQSEMAKELGLSQPEVSNALRRLQASHLALHGSREIIVPHLLEFCEHGLRYVFAADIGRPKRGMPTASLASPLREKIGGEEGALVWPSPDGTIRATSLEPLHSCALRAAAQDPRMHRVLSLLDGIRVGRNRMRQVAVELLAEELKKPRTQNEE